VFAGNGSLPPRVYTFLKHSLPHGSEYPKHGPSVSHASFLLETSCEILVDIRARMEGRGWTAARDSRISGVA